MKQLKNKEIDREKWMQLLQKSSFSTPFQTPEYYDLFNSVEGYSADVFATEEEGEYKSLVVVTIQKEKGVKGHFSKRGIIYGGILIANAEDGILEPLLNEVKSYYKKKLIYLEIRNNYDYSSFIPEFEKSGYLYEKHLNVQLNIKNVSVEDILSGMKYNRRREIRLSYKEGATVRLAENEEEVKEVYAILEDLYVNRVKLPLGPYDYFLNLYKSKVGKVFVVNHNNKIIGGSFCVYYDGMTINTFYYAGLRSYHKKIFPTHIAIMGIIEFAIENNLKMVDFMGAGKPDKDYGVRDFKLQFGGDLVEHGRFKYICNPLLYKTGILGLKVLSKIK